MSVPINDNEDDDDDNEIFVVFMFFFYFCVFRLVFYETDFFNLFLFAWRRMLTYGIGKSV